MYIAILTILVTSLYLISKLIIYINKINTGEITSKEFVKDLIIIIVISIFILPIWGYFVF